MAIDTQGFRLLLAAHKAGADFSRTLTFGRQNYHPKARHVAAALKASGLAPGRETILSLPNGYAEPFLRALGAETVDSLDTSPYEHATIIHDLNEPVPASLHGRYTLVFDGGTSEHVYNYPQALENAVRLLAVGGHFVSITTGNNFPGHGFYQISPELFFRVFSPANGFDTRAVLLAGARPGRRFYRVADPAALRSRVEFVTREPHYVAVIARKTAPVDRLAVPPVQSDYAAAWDAGPRSSAGRLRRECRRIGAQVRSFFGRRFNLAWQNRGLSPLSDREFYSL